MHFTDLDLQSINSITHQYDIKEIISFHTLSGGSVNSNYQINSKTKSYVLTICEQKPRNEADLLAQFLEHLANNGFSSSKVIRNRNEEFTSLYQDKPVLLKTFLSGRIEADLSNHLLRLIGMQMGRLHKIEAPSYLPKKLSYGIEHFEEVSLYAPNSDFRIWLKNIQNQIEPYLHKGLPKSLIHSDVFHSNVIVSNDDAEVTIMDFEEACHYYRVYDLGMAIIGLCAEGESINLQKVAPFLKGYSQEIELTNVEQRALQQFTVYAAASMTFWRHRNFNYTNPTPGMEDHYLGLKCLADYVNSLEEDCFYNILINA